MATAIDSSNETRRLDRRTRDSADGGDASSPRIGIMEALAHPMVSTERHGAQARARGSTTPTLSRSGLAFFIRLLPSQCCSQRVAAAQLRSANNEQCQLKRSAHACKLRRGELTEIYGFGIVIDHALFLAVLYRRGEELPNDGRKKNPQNILGVSRVTTTNTGQELWLQNEKRDKVDRIKTRQRACAV